jgi:hypothetical protein
MDLLVISTFCKRKGRLHRHVERGPLNKIEMTGTNSRQGLLILVWCMVQMGGLSRIDRFITKQNVKVV